MQYYASKYILSFMIVVNKHPKELTNFPTFRYLVCIWTNEDKSR